MGHNHDLFQQGCNKFGVPQHVIIKRRVLEVARSKKRPSAELRTQLIVNLYSLSAAAGRYNKHVKNAPVQLCDEEPFLKWQLGGGRRRGSSASSDSGAAAKSKSQDAAEQKEDSEEEEDEQTYDRHDAHPANHIRAPQGGVDTDPNPKDNVQKQKRKRMSEKAACLKEDSDE